MQFLHVICKIPMVQAFLFATWAVEIQTQAVPEEPITPSKDHNPCMSLHLVFALQLNRPQNLTQFDVFLCGSFRVSRNGQCSVE